MDTVWSYYRQLVLTTCLVTCVMTSDVCKAFLSLRGHRSKVECDCVMSGPDLIVDCSSNGLIEIPLGAFPDNTAKINLKNNKLTYLTTHGFLDLPILRSLYIDMNDVIEVEPNAFRGLTALEQIGLSRNDLGRIHSWTFQDLVSIRTISLSSNNITVLSKDAFYFMKNLSEIDISGNRLFCGCNAKLFRDWTRNEDIFVRWPLCRNANDTSLGDVADDVFGRCLDPPAQTCVSCHSSSVRECLSGGSMETCGSLDSCQMTVDVISGQQVVKSRCQQSAECAAELKGNSRSCLNGHSDQRCIFCCTGSNCTSQLQLKGYTYRTSVVVSFVMRVEYNTDLYNHSSDVYTELAYEVTTKLDSVLTIVDQLTTGPPMFRPRADAENMTYTLCRISVHSVWPLAMSTTEVQQALFEMLNLAISNGDLDLGVIDGTLEVIVPEYCLPEVQDSSKGVLQWPSTLAGMRAEVDCPYPQATGSKATRWCDPGPSRVQASPEWLTPDLSACVEPSDVTKKLKDLLNMPVTNETVSYIASELRHLTSGTLASVDVGYVSQLLENVVTSNAFMELGGARDMVSTYNNIIVTSEDVLKDSQRGFGAIKRSLLALDMLSQTFVTMPPGDTLTQQTVSLGVILDVSDVTQGAVFNVARRDVGDFGEGQVTLTLNQTSVDAGSVDASISMPGSVLTYVAQHGTAQFVVFSDDTLFQVMNAGINVTSGMELTPNSHVMAATFGGVHLPNLPDPVVITFRHKQQVSGPRKCVFWDYGVSSADGAWSDQGCRLLQDADDYSVCECDHLTNFALIMDIYGTAGNITGANKKALSIISYVGCGVSLASLILTLGTYLIFSKLRKDNPSKLLMNLCAALTMVMVLFIVVTQPGVREKPRVCQAMAGLLHYFLIATWVWMAIEAFNMYLTLIKIFNTYMSRFLLKCSLIGWGVPVIVVIITVAISTDNYGLQGEICWLKSGAFYGACMAPILLILVGNFVVFGLVIHQIRKLSQRSTERSTKFLDTKTQLRGAFAVVVLLGLTWIFAIFAVGGAGIAFNYLFAIFNSFQGLFIFIFYCLLKKDVKDTWREKWTTITSSTGATSSDQSGGKALEQSIPARINNAVTSAKRRVFMALPGTSKYSSTSQQSGISSSEPSELRTATSKDIRALRGIGPVTGSRERLNASYLTDIVHETADSDGVAETSS